MEIKISSQKFELTEALKQHINKKISKLDRYESFFTLAEVHIEVEKYRNIARILIKGGGGEQIFSEVIDKDSMYKAIDLCAQKIEKQIIQSKKHPNK
ncbi:MAG: ribosome-associated translation inhibitor RaiA [SAR324 cluster bacterium]|nr:ribosome-associated translation inhibitor RaiA [SAR324 cluster bacterium]